jgi:hypothetical protein
VEQRIAADAHGAPELAEAGKAEEAAPLA